MNLRITRQGCLESSAIIRLLPRRCVLGLVAIPAPIFPSAAAGSNWVALNLPVGLIRYLYTQPIYRVAVGMEWSVNRASDPSTGGSFMYMGNDHNGGSRDHHTLMAMLNSCPLPALRGLEETGYSAARNSAPKRSFYSMFDPQVEATEMEENMRLRDQCSNASHVEKKRRLTVEQVRSLELSFETENKLEPERKMLLARQLGLQPRQVAVWFQNRRARWKTKQLERVYDALKEDFGALLAEKERLQAEVIRLTAKLEAKNSGSDAIVKSDRSGEDKLGDSDEDIGAKDRIHNSCDHSLCEVGNPNVAQYNIADISDNSTRGDDKIEAYSSKLQAIKDLSAACSDVSEIGDAGSPPEQDHPNAAVHSRDSASSIQIHHKHDAAHRPANNVNASLNATALDNMVAAPGSGPMFNPQQLLHHQIHHASAFKFEEGIGYFAADDLPYSGWFNEPDDHHDLPLWC